ncbi:MAG: UDP-N-acetylmuramoyl-L-alanine--D-glutamate ligase, partial [Saprospiraceae bacterium]
CLVGLDSINGKLVWIAGGVDKGNDYAQLDKALEGKLEGLVCLTTDDKKLRSHFSYLEDRILTTENMDEAVRWAAERVGEGTVLLSPACASFDLFDNYEHRGKSFKDSVIKYLDDFDQ